MSRSFRSVPYLSHIWLSGAGNGTLCPVWRRGAGNGTRSHRVLFRFVSFRFVGTLTASLHVLLRLYSYSLSFERQAKEPAPITLRF